MDERLRRLAEPPNFAALTTLLPDGQPQTHVMWFDAEGEHLMVNTEPQRQKYRNIRQDPRVTLTIWDRADAYHFVEARGRVIGELRGERARIHQDRLSIRYTGVPYDQRGIQTERIALQIAVEHVFELRLNLELGATAVFTEP